MTAKEKIFSNFQGVVSKPDALRYMVPLQRCENPVSAFIETATKAGSACYEVNSMNDVVEWIRKTNSGQGTVISKVSDVKGTLSSAGDDEFDCLVVKGATGISENGAVWLDDGAVPERKLLFLCKHLAIVLDEHDIVADLMQADLRARSLSVRYGVLVSGPSKTADIEQSLVMGAQGPLSCHVFIVKSGSR